MNNNITGRLPGHDGLWSALQRTYIIMKLSILLLIISIAQVSGKAFGQITIHQQNAKMTSILRVIEQQSGYVFVFNEDKIKFGTVSIDINNASIKETLDACFKNTDIAYQIINKNVVLHKKEEIAAAKSPQYTFLQPVLVIGQVTNAQRQPLIGATVLVKRLKTGVTTDLKGRYVLKTADPADTLLFSYLGYETQVIALSNRIKSNPIIDVVLSETTNQMDEVVVQGYGKTSRRLATGNITRVAGEELVKQPVMNPILALQGKVAGVIITPTTGSASGPVKIEIRGRKALNPEFPSDPLYIINGVPQTVLEVFGRTASGDGTPAYSRGFDQSGITPGQSPFFSINPQDIESIEVLKDADATAIYGSRGANGVIIITTKKGKPGKARVNFSANRGVNFATRFYEMLNTEQYLAMRKEAFFNSGEIPTATSAYDLLTFDQNRYTDWQRYTKGANSQTDYQGSISGGSELTTYRIGASLGITNDINTISGKNQRGTFSLSLHNQTADQRFSMDFDASYSLVDVDAITLRQNITLPPNAPDPFDEQGNLNFAGWGAAHASYPFGDLKNTQSQSGNALSSSMGLNYNIVKGLSATLRGGYNTNLNTVTALRPIAGQDPLAPTVRYGSAQFGTTRSKNVIIEPQFNYNALISKGSLSLLAGGTYQVNTTNGIELNGSNYTDDALLGTITNAPTVKAIDRMARYKYAGVFARVNFNWDGKYIINLNGRRDGSSRFGVDSRFGNFYSIGAAWNISDETWVKRVLPEAISLIKIRGSYGITGSDAVGDYKYLTQYGNPTGQGDYNGVSPIMPQIQPNSDYHWQVNKSTEISLDLGFFKDRLNFNVSAYRSYCDNQLIDFMTPAFTGFSSVVANSPAEVVNDGIEFQLNGSFIQSKNFRWSASFNTGFNRNRLLSYPNLDKSPYASIYKIGSSVSNTYVLNYLGIDPLTGEYTFEDYDKNNSINIVGGPESRGDKYIAVKTVPDFTGNMTHTFAYKGFSLTANFYIVKQKGKSYLYTVGSGTNTNISVERYNTRWQKPGDQALTSKLTVTPSAYSGFISQSTQGYTDASFIRLNSLHLAGSLPDRFARKLGVSNLSLNVSASNIFVITKYKGLDPVVQNFGGTLPMRTISMGLNSAF
jgi:TonB-linked SusC/RagA family outer membrane protein